MICMYVCTYTHIHIYICIFGLHKEATVLGSMETRGRSQFSQRSEVPDARRHVSAQLRILVETAAKTPPVRGPAGGRIRRAAAADAQSADPRRASQVAERCGDGPAQASSRKHHRAAVAWRRALFRATPREGAVRAHAALAVALERHAVCNTIEKCAL